MKQFGVVEKTHGRVRYAARVPDEFDEDVCTCRPKFEPRNFDLIVKDSEDATWRTHSGPFTESVAHEIADALKIVEELNEANERLRSSLRPPTD